MTNRIFFSIDTEAPYTKSETDDLLDSFITFMIETDGDVDTDSAAVEINSVENVNEASELRKRAVIEDFLKKIQVTARINIAETEGVGVEFNLD